MEEKKFLQYLINPKIVFIILLLAVVLPYSNIFPNEFAYDDPAHFETWEGIKNFDLRAYFAGEHPRNYHHLYRPLRTVMQAIVYKFTDSKPFGYHIFSILVHFINTYLIYLIAKKLTNRIAAFATAIIFAVLPVHVMSVTFMTASFNTAGVIFILLSFYFFILFREKGLKKYFSLSLALAIIAYFSYEATLIIPLLLILYEICFRDIHQKNIFSEMKYIGWYFLGGAVFFLIRQQVLQSIYTKPFLVPIEFSHRMLTESKALVEYMYLTIVNYPLDTYHHVELSKSLDINVFFSLLLVLFLFFLGYFFWKKGKKIYTFIIFWFFIGMLPYSNIVQISSFVDEQYLYLASFSWALFLGYTFSVFLEKHERGATGYKRIVALGFVVLSFTYGYISSARNFEWKNNETLWTKTIRLNPKFGRSYAQLGDYYMSKGDFARAEEYLLKGISIFPDLSSLHVTLGVLYDQKGNLQRAKEQYIKAIELSPNYASTYHNLGYIYLREGNIDTAVENFKKTIELSPVFYESIFDLGVIYLDQKKFSESKNMFERAIQLRSKSHEAFFGLGMSYMGLGDNALAKKYFEKTLELKADFTPALEMLKKLKSR